MREKTVSIRSQLAALVPIKIDAEEVKRRGWIEQGILVISVNDPDLHWTEKESIKQIGERKYGRRPG